MNFHEYQAKALFREYDIPVPVGQVVRSAEDLDGLDLGEGTRWVAKAQVHAGGRGKAGGVQLVEGRQALREAVESMLGSRLVTHQTGPEGLPVEAVLVEPVTDIQREIYLGVLVDRERERVVFMASSAGGMDIETVAAQTPEKILTVPVHPAAGLMPYQARRVAFFLGLSGGQIRDMVRIMSGLYRLFTEKDASLVEINPLVINGDGDLLALDAKFGLDDSAAYRQKVLAGQFDDTQEDERERVAGEYGLNYIPLDGNIGCMVNGAGLAMATMDLIQLEGGEPANFLDVGGGTTTEKVAEAFKLILSDSNVKAILVNIFGGIVRCDLIAEGIIQAVQEVEIEIPVVVRLEGTNAEQGRDLLAESGLAITPAADLSEAARKAVAAV